jgi:hypothetical protein
MWPLRADTRASSTFDGVAVLSGKTFTSESTNHAEKLSRCAAFSGREKKQITQAKTLHIIYYLEPVPPVEVAFAAKNRDCCPSANLSKFY